MVGTILYWLNLMVKENVEEEVEQDAEEVVTRNEFKESLFASKPLLCFLSRGLCRL